jgi:hypothetical protein
MNGKNNGTLKSHETLKKSPIRRRVVNTCLMVLILTLNYVYGDVESAVVAGPAPAPAITVTAAQFPFIAAANAVAFVGGGFPAVIAATPAAGAVPAFPGCPFSAQLPLVVAGNVAVPAYAMPGFAAFFPAAGGAGAAVQLYFGALRSIHGGFSVHAPLNTTAANSRYMSDSSHTERQLIVASLNGAGAINGAGWAAGPGAVAAAAGVSAAGGGDVHVFARSSPCVRWAGNNGGILCVDYYWCMTTQYPTLNFHVYFPAVNIEIIQDFFPVEFDALVANLAALLPAAPVHGAGAVGPVGLTQFRLNNPGGGGAQQLQFNIDGVWKAVATFAAGIWTATAVLTTPGGQPTWRRGLFCDTMRFFLSNNPLQATAFFNAIHGRAAVAGGDGVAGNGAITYHAL